MNSQFAKLFIFCCTLSILCIVGYSFFLSPQIYNFQNDEFNKKIQPEIYTNILLKIEDELTEVKALKILSFPRLIIKSKLINQLNLNYGFMPIYLFSNSLMPGKEVQSQKDSNILYIITLLSIILLIALSFAVWKIIQQKKLTEIRKDFINNMTHDLKSPISNISLSTEMLNNPKIINDPKKLHQYTDIIHQETERLKTHVDKVLQIAAIDKKKIKLQKEKTNLHKIIKKTIKGFQLALDKNEADIVCRLNAKKYYVHGDPTHLTNILFNLIDNAIKYCDRKAKVIISTENHKQGIYLRVIDNGIGMSRQDQKHVFEKFYRVSSEGTSEAAHGYGIGLNYVLKMVKQHHGKIQLKSQQKSGSTFRIFLPLVKNGNS